MFIYIIKENKCDSMFYIGSTNNFKKRMFHHKKSLTNRSSRKYNILLYKYMRCLGGWNYFTMEILEHIPNATKQELLIKEGEYIKKLKPVLNTIQNPIKII